MIDSRAGRVLEEQRRRMVDDEEFAWIEAAMQRAADEGVQHLILGTSLPWLLPHAIHNLERWNETLNVRHERALARPARREAAAGGRPGALGRLRRLVRAAGPRADVASPAASTGRRPRRRWCSPATSTTPTPPSWCAPATSTTRVHQLTVSPLHNQAPHPIRVGFRIGWSRWAKRFTDGAWPGSPGRAERAGVGEAGRAVLRQPDRRAGARPAARPGSSCR